MEKDFKTFISELYTDEELEEFENLLRENTDKLKVENLRGFIRMCNFDDNGKPIPPENRTVVN
tara:strand:- start:11053 stop:11241 length:189 start_codon:yes stop_codon:yes gene_type:complete